MLKGFNKEDKERQIRPILARQVWLNESGASVVPCGRDLSLAVAFVEKKLTKKERADFRSHLLECRHCRQFVSSEVRLQRPVFEPPAVIPVSRESFFDRIKFQWVTAAAGLILAAGVTSFLVMNHGSNVDHVAIGPTPGISTPVAVVETNPIPTGAPDKESKSATVSPGEMVVDKPVAPASTLASIDLGGLAGAGGNSASSGSATSPIVTAPSVADNKKDLKENALNVDGSAVNSIASTTAALSNPPTPVTGDPVNASSEYKIRVEPANLETQPVTPAGRTTELKTELISTNLSDLEQASINIPTSGSGFVRRDSEVVIISHPLVPWTTSINRPPADVRGEGFVAKGSRYSYNQTKIALGGKLFNQVDKVWIDQEYTSSSNLPVVKVKVKSPEGQEILAANPGLKPFFTMHKQVVVVYEGKVYMTY